MDEWISVKERCNDCPIDYPDKICENYECYSKLLEFKLQESEKRIEELENEKERAYQILELNGVPRERAKNICNGIEVLIIRFVKEISYHHQKMYEDALSNNN